MLRFACRSAVVPVTSGARAVAQLSASNAVLKNNHEACKYKSAVWVEEDDKYWWQKVASVKDGEKPTQALAPARIELYNLDQLQTKVDVKGAEGKLGHYSVKTQKRYSGNFQDKLEQFAAKNKLDSKWWLSGAEIRKQQYRLRPNATPCVQIIEKQVAFYNADQFDHPEVIANRAYSGATGRSYAEGTAADMEAHAENNGYSCAVYFTERQLEALGITIGAGIEACEVSVQRQASMKLFPVEEVDNGNKFLEELNRYPVSAPTYAISGQPLQPPMLELAQKMKGITSNYWVSQAEITSRKYKLKADAKGIAPKMDGPTFKAYNIEQLSDEDQLIAAKAMGRVVTI